jgi:hypothetical protein
MVAASEDQVASTASASDDQGASTPTASDDQGASAVAAAQDQGASGLPPADKPDVLSSIVLLTDRDGHVGHVQFNATAIAALESSATATSRVELLHAGDVGATVGTTALAAHLLPADLWLLEVAAADLHDLGLARQAATSAKRIADELAPTLASPGDGLNPTGRAESSAVLSTPAAVVQLPAAVTNQPGAVANLPAAAASQAAAVTNQPVAVANVPGAAASHAAAVTNQPGAAASPPAATASPPAAVASVPSRPAVTAPTQTTSSVKTTTASVSVTVQSATSSGTAKSPK